MKLAKTFARAASFAHLLGLAAKAEDDDTAANAEDQTDDDERKQRDGESDDDYAKRMQELDDKEDADDGNPDDNPDANNGNEQEDDKAKGARTEERARCAAIIAHGIKAGCVEQAGVFAFDTRLSAAEAISALKAGASATAARPALLAARMSAVVVPKVGTDAAAGPDASTAEGQAALIIAAAKKCRNEA